MPNGGGENVPFLTGLAERVRHTLRALNHRNYRLFFGGQGVSLIGTWMQSTAVSWLVYRMTSSERYLGLVNFAGQGMTFVLAPLAGVLCDRWNRHRMVIATQALAAVQAGALAALTLAGAITIWQIILLCLLFGMIRAFEIPSRQTFVADMIERRGDLPSAIAMNSFLVNGAKLLGPMVAGLLMAHMSEGMCFFWNAVSYLFVIAALLAMRIAPRRQSPHEAHVLHSLKEGLTYAWRSAPIRSVLMLVCAVSLLGMPYGVLLPVFARRILGGGPQMFGLLVGATGAGAIVAAVFLASQRSVKDLGRMVAAAPIVMGLGLIAFAMSRWLWLSLPLLVALGFAQMVQMAGSNTILQTIVHDDKRGRVMSLYTVAFMGTVPFGALFAGELAKHIGAPWTVLLAGFACVVAGILFAEKFSQVRAALSAERAAIAPETIASGEVPPADSLTNARQTN